MRYPVCVKCQVQFQKIKSGVSVIDMFSRPPRPYQIWMADLFECPGCKVRIVSGFADRPFAQHFNRDFKHLLGIHSDGFEVYNYERLSDVPRVIEAANGP